MRAGLALLTAAARAAPKAPLPGSILPLRDTTSVLPLRRLSAPSKAPLEGWEGSASLDAPEVATAQAAAILLPLIWCARMCAASGAVLGPASPAGMPIHLMPCRNPQSVSRHLRTVGGIASQAAALLLPLINAILLQQIYARKCVASGALIGHASPATVQVHTTEAAKSNAHQAAAMLLCMVC